MSAEISYDWEVTHGFRNGVRHQGNCDSCWAFPPTQAVECLYFIQHKTEVSLSPQRLLNCCNPKEIAEEKEHDECYKTTHSVAFQYIKDHGICREIDCEYEAVAKKCDPMLPENLIKITGYTRIMAMHRAELIKRVIDQPVAARVKVCEQFIMLKKNEVYEKYELKDPERSGEHGVLVVGYGRYGTNGSKQFWRVKNSWGTKWCDGGYGNVAMNSEIIYHFYYPTGVEKFASE